MLFKNFYIYTFFVLTIIVLLVIIQYEKNKNSELMYNIQTMEQNNNSNIQIISSLQTNEDELKNRIRLLEQTVITSKDTIVVYKTSIDSIIHIQTSDSLTSYKLYDKIHYPRFEMKFEVYLELLNDSLINHSFGYNYISFPDTISVSTFFDKGNKLLYSEALVNGVGFRSEANMYEKVYKGIYEGFIGGNINNVRWYERIGCSVGIGYNWRGEWLPYIGLGYNYNIKEIKGLWK